jgi:branched-chain amino acid transport system ATP-binding protein
MTTLAVRDLDVYIQASHILRNVTLEVGPEEVVCLVGRNGAGKTTLLRTVMGYLRPRAGRRKCTARPPCCG